MRAEMLRSQFETLEPTEPEEALAVSVEGGPDEIVSEIVSRLDELGVGRSKAEASVRVLAGSAHDRTARVSTVVTVDLRLGREETGIALWTCPSRCGHADRRIVGSGRPRAGTERGQDRLARRNDTSRSMERAASRDLRAIERGQSCAAFPAASEDPRRARDIVDSGASAGERRGAVGGEPKTEMWFIALLNRDLPLPGVKEGNGRASSKGPSPMARGRLINRIEVSAGDTIFIPSGSLHAIGAGM